MKQRERQEAKAKPLANSSVHEDIVALAGNVDTFKEAQLIKQANLKLKHTMQLRKILQEDISGKTGFEYQIAMEMKKDAARQLGYHFNE